MAEPINLAKSASPKTFAVSLAVRHTDRPDKFFHLACLIRQFSLEAAEFYAGELIAAMFPPADGWYDHDAVVNAGYARPICEITPVDVPCEPDEPEPQAG